MATRQRSRSSRTAGSNVSGNQLSTGAPGSTQASEQVQDSAILRAGFDTRPFEDSTTSTLDEAAIPKATFVGEQIIYKDREARIAELAYSRAEHRGFAPGYELDDWLAAEKEIDTLLSSAPNGGDAAR